MVPPSQYDVAARLGALDAMVQEIKEQLQSLRHYDRELEQRLRSAELDLSGTAEQLRASLATISDLTNGQQAIKDALAELHHLRQQQWAQHNLDCNRCFTRIQAYIKHQLEAIKEELQTLYQTDRQKLENLGVIALCQRYWWQIALLTAFVLSALQIKVEVWKKLFQILFHD